MFSSFYSYPPPPTQPSHPSPRVSPPPPPPEPCLTPPHTTVIAPLTTTQGREQNIDFLLLLRINRASEKLGTAHHGYKSQRCRLIFNKFMCIQETCSSPHSSARIAQWLERRTRDRKVAGSSPGRSGRRIFFSRANFSCLLLFRYPFHTRVTAVARKSSRSFCQKCRWQLGYSLIRMHPTYVTLHEVT